MILLLHGGDALATRRRLQQIKDEADGGSGMLATNFSEIEGRDAKVHEILGPCMSPPFLAPFRLVVIANLLSRFEPPRDGRAPRSVEPLAPLFAAIEAGIPESTILVFTGGQLDKRNGLIARLAKLKAVTNEEYAALNVKDAPRYIREEAAARGIRFRAGASRQTHFDSEVWTTEQVNDPAMLLSTLTQNDTLRIANELDKLALFGAGREIRVDDIYEICAGEREANAFKFTDAVLDGKHLEALNALGLLMRDGESVQGLLGLLMAAYRRLAAAIDLLQEGATPDEIGRATRTSQWPGLRDALIRRAKRLGPGGLETAYEALVEADRRNKLGEVDDDLALELAVARLTQVGMPARRAG